MLVGLVAIIIFFQLERSVFLTDGNLVDLFEQASIYVMLGAAEIFVLLLSEIDLSLGYGAGVGAFVIAELIAAPVNFPWWLGIIGGLAVVGLLGAIQGTLIARLGLPSFIVTLGGQLGFLGSCWRSRMSTAPLSAASSRSIRQPDLQARQQQHEPCARLDRDAGAAWAVCGRHALPQPIEAPRGLHDQPLGVTLSDDRAGCRRRCRAGADLQRERGHSRPEGMPWVIPFVLLVHCRLLVAAARTRTGRYIYAVGANPEAARRAGINVKRVVTFGFVMSGVTRGLAGLIYESNLGSMSTDIDGGELVLFAVAAAVIGGASLFGGRGKMVNALLGGIVIAAVFNGLALMGVGAAVRTWSPPSC